MTQSRDWIDILAALLTPTIAILGAYIAWQQWRTNRNKLKLDLFDKRFQVFENIKKFIASILTSGRVEDGTEFQFLRDTKSVRFLFQDDATILNLIDEIYKKAIKLHTLERTERGSSGQTLENNLNKQNEIKEWYQNQLHTIDEIFKKYLILKH
jgi:hypothetical protein